MKNFHSVVLINSLLLLYGFGSIQASEGEAAATEERHKKHSDGQQEKSYERYFMKQKELYEDLVKKGIPGARPLRMNKALAEAVLATCPEDINDVISDIEQSMFRGNEKNIVLYGLSGTGKSCLAQAIAIKTQTPCLIFSAAGVLIESMNPWVQNLNKVCEHVKKLEEDLDKPCIIIFDGLEALTKKYAGKNNQENNILTSFWQLLENFGNGKVIVIGTMNVTEDIPDQITDQTSMVEIPLSNAEHRKTVLDYYFKANQDEYKITYPTWLTAAGLARQTEGSSNKELKNLVERITKSVRSNKTDDIATEIKKIKKNPKRKLAKVIGTLGHAFKKYCLDPKNALHVAGLATTMFIAHKYIASQETGLKQTKEIADKNAEIQERAMKQAADIAERQANLQKEAMEQTKTIADKQTSAEHMTRQAIINSLWKDVCDSEPECRIALMGYVNGEIPLKANLPPSK
ncbi:MAG: AAA family ATPase [Candidatus Dependentiae bacterium]|nr:AAA family ATPase [Candidatus Dependentiae bacterium]